MRPDHLLPEETNLLYVLLDAADGTGALTTGQRARWLECQEHFNTENARRYGPELYELLDELSRGGGLGEVWIQKRWLGLRAQVEARLAQADPAVIRRRRERGRPSG